jgi:hypothetical protein
MNLRSLDRVTIFHFYLNFKDQPRNFRLDTNRQKRMLFWFGGGDL